MQLIYHIKKFILIYKIGEKIDNKIHHKKIKMTEKNNKLELQNIQEKQAESNKSELELIIKNLEDSLNSFQLKINTVFNGTEMSPEQKEKTEEIISSKTKVLNELRYTLGQITESKHELNLKHKELNVYSSVSIDDDKLSEEYIKLQEKISDLQKIIFELDEKQAILTKEFDLISSGKRLNQNLDKKEIEIMENITTIDFLKIDFKDRLKYLTVENISSADVLSGRYKDIEINFSFNGHFNRQLYLDVTAGMILPLEVRELKVGDTIYKRGEKFLKGEFFDKKGKILTISDGTKISIEKVLTTEELEKKYKFEDKENDPKILAKEAKQRGVPEELAKHLVKPDIQSADSKTANAEMEYSFSHIDQQKGYFAEEFNINPVDENGNFNANFLLYLLGGIFSIFEKFAKGLGFGSEEIEGAKQFGKENIPSREYKGDLSLEKLLAKNISPEDVKRIRSKKKFKPYSEDTVTLFKIATKTAGLPESWAINKNTHYILQRESNGIVGALNYTIKGMSLEKFKEKSLQSNLKNPIGAKSTASGLGQLLLSNVDKYYPSGRKGIGDPIEEAIGFLNYIKDRYGNPDVAKSVYGKKGSYIHAGTGKKEYKGFREGY
ncbi:hypothetical protein DLH72_03055 [Candidatus Gracilibacteria bacterium]|nr:MAG: hypothetical protein DLH72_03055 [Candidatus Gracilibacteria bacterium]